MIDIPKHKKIILFDGVCNLCNNSVIKAIKYDTKNTFLFASLQSESGQKIVNHLNIDTCLLYTSPSPRDLSTSRMPSSA